MIPLIALVARPHPYLLEEARRRGWRLTLVSNYLPREISFQAALVEGMTETPVVEELVSHGVKIVRIGIVAHPEGEPYPAVIFDQISQGRLAAEHFRARSFRHVAYFGNEPWYLSQELFEGFENQAKKTNLECHLFRQQRIKVEAPEAHRERTRDNFLQWIKDLPKPVGLLTPSAIWAERMSFWIYQTGLRIPEDVAILSRSQRPDVCECCMPTVSEIDTNEEGRIHIACDLIQEFLNGGTPPVGPIQIPPLEVHVRESTRTLATSDPIAEKAIQFIWENYTMELSVDDIAKEVGVPKRSLQRVFKNEFNRGVSEEIRRKRIEEVAHLLESTALTLPDICIKTGIRSTSYLHRAFQATYEMTPSEYRNVHGV
jgi:LacI family transcriptional regulator